MRGVDQDDAGDAEPDTGSRQYARQRPENVPNPDRSRAAAYRFRR
jgi:hypothetical protein